MRRKIIILLLIFMFTAIGWSQLFSNTLVSAVDLKPEELIRLHVVANSDSIMDQTIKIKVRDAVIDYLRPKLEKCSSIEQSRQVISEHKEKIVNIAKQAVLNENQSYGVKIEAGYQFFPLKSYGTMVFPAGQYEAVKIILGNGEGKNWWCVLFPPLCFIDAANATAVPAVQNENKDDKKIEFRLKLVEMLKLK